ncbi:MAG: hypothetical protein AAFZ09_17935, partial [Pseudomonadota bacterium]
MAQPGDGSGPPIIANTFDHCVGPKAGFNTQAFEMTPGALEALEREPEDEGDADAWPEYDDSEDYESTAEAALDAPALESSVRWPEDADSPEYGHLLTHDRALSGTSFEFTVADLELLIAANAFRPNRTAGRIIFGLRGAMLDGGTNAERAAQVDRPSLRLKDARPDHHNFRCVIGVYNLAERTLSGFISSTVPNRYAVNNYRTRRNSGNIMLTGCYRYIVGGHSKNRYPGCLRQNQRFVVLRSVDNNIYDQGDIFDPGWQFDNIHPAFSDRKGGAQFSSYGCQTIRGTCTRGTDRHRGEWAQFRKALGL